MSDRKSEVDIVLEGLDSKPPVDSERWERPTKARIRKIEQLGPKETYPPNSAGRHWSPAGVVLVLTTFGAMCVTAGGALGPLFMKPDLTGYVKEERLKACETRLDERQKQADDAMGEQRRQTGRCYQLLGDCRSQTGAQEQLIESMDPKKRRR